MIKTEDLTIMFLKTKEVWTLSFEFFNGLDDIYLFEEDGVLTSESKLGEQFLKIKFDKYCNMESIHFEKVK